MESVRPRAAADTRPPGAARPALITVDVPGVALLAATAAVYALVATVSLLVVLDTHGFAGIWPPAGIALGILLITHRRRWPWVLLGVVVAVVAANIAAGAEPLAIAGYAVANTVEPLVSASLLRRLGFRSLATLRDVGRFIGCAAFGGPAVGGAIGAVVASSTIGGPLVPGWVSWVLSDAGGVMAVAPVLLLLRESRRAPLSGTRALEAVAVGLGVVSVTAIAFLPIPIGIQPMAYPIFLILVVAAVRFGTTGAALSTLGVAIIATLGTVAGHGPIAGLNDAPAVQMGQLHILVAVVFLVAFVTAAAMAERRAAADAVDLQRHLEASRAERNLRITTFAREIAQSLEAESLFQRLVAAAVGVIDADMARLTIARDNGSHRIVAAVGAPSSIGRTVTPGDGVTGSVIRDGRLVVRDHVPPTERVSTTRDVMPDRPLAVACAPILNDGHVVATLALARLDLSDPFAPDEGRALELMAELAALALRNSGEFERTQELSIRDELTGVPNRRYFTASFEQLAAQRARLAPESRVPISALMFDLDHFGPINKERGHATGDAVLAEFGRLIASRLRRADVVARYGGEEFVALLVGTGRDDAARVAEEIRATFESTEHVGADGEPIRCTVSVGVATVEATEPSIDVLLPTADVALAMAKRAGRNTVSAA